MASMDTADEKVARRAPIELEHSTAVRDRTDQYEKDKTALENDFLQDLAAIREARIADLRAAGLNPDGSSPYENPQG